MFNKDQPCQITKGTSDPTRSLRRHVGERSNNIAAHPQQSVLTTPTQTTQTTQTTQPKQLSKHPVKHTSGSSTDSTDSSDLVVPKQEVKPAAKKNVAPPSNNPAISSAAVSTIVRKKKVLPDANGKMSFQDKHVYSPQRIESWSIDPATKNKCTSNPTITETAKRSMFVSSLSNTCESKISHSVEAECPVVNFAPDSSFLVCKAKGALGAKDLLKIGGSERRIADTFASIVRQDGGWNKRPHVVDVGMNEGFFTLLSASLGGNVIAFDMNPVCFAAMDRAIEINSFENSIELRNVGLIKGMYILLLFISWKIVFINS